MPRDDLVRVFGPRDSIRFDVAASKSVRQISPKRYSFGVRNSPKPAFGFRAKSRDQSAPSGKFECFFDCGRQFGRFDRIKSYLDKAWSKLHSFIETHRQLARVRRSDGNADLRIAPHVYLRVGSVRMNVAAVTSPVIIVTAEATTNAVSPLCLTPTAAAIHAIPNGKK